MSLDLRRLRLLETLMVASQLWSRMSRGSQVMLGITPFRPDKDVDRNTQAFSSKNYLISIISVLRRSWISTVGLTLGIEGMWVSERAW